MLEPMDVSAAAPGPALALGIAVTAGLLALAAAAGLLMSRPGASRRVPPPPPGRPATPLVHDDLPAFHAHPPGSPGAPFPAPAPAAGPEPAGTATGRANPARALTGMALVALVLVAAAAGVAYAARRTADGGEPRATTAPRADAPSPAAASAPARMSVPATPTAGQPGAGELAYLSVPLGRDGLLARLRFGGVVLEQRAVGLTVAYPSVSVTTGSGGAALAHVRLDTFNCLTAEPPPDPSAAGCARSVPEYADLPAPALTVVQEGGTVRLTGRFPTYTRPNGTGPLYTGRVYDLTVAVRADLPAHGRTGPAGGTFYLGTGRAEAVDEPGADVVQRGG
jgi:hypothetical protein